MMDARALLLLSLSFLLGMPAGAGAQLARRGCLKVTPAGETVAWEIKLDLDATSLPGQPIPVLGGIIASGICGAPNAGWEVASGGSVDPATDGVLNLNAIRKGKGNCAKVVRLSGRRVESGEFVGDYFFGLRSKALSFTATFTEGACPPP